MNGDGNRATPSGFSSHAEQVAPADDRVRLERLARYIPRAPIWLDALELIGETPVEESHPANNSCSVLKVAESVFAETAPSLFANRILSTARI